MRSKLKFKKCRIEEIRPANAFVQLLSYSKQIACGLQYLSSKSLFHAVFSAQNVLVIDDNICKVRMVQQFFSKSLTYLFTTLVRLLMLGGQKYLRKATPFLVSKQLLHCVQPQRPFTTTNTLQPVMCGVMGVCCMRYGAWVTSYLRAWTMKV